MSQVLDNILDHIQATLEKPPAGSLAAFSGYRSGMFVSLDKMSGGRLELEELVGQSRVFEIDLANRETSLVRLGNAVPSSYNDTIPILVRYDGQGRHDKNAVLRKVTKDSLFLVDAIMRSSWSSITGCVSLNVEVAGIDRFELADANSAAVFEGYILTLAVFASYDI